MRLENRPKDVPYCGVSKTKIQNSKPTLDETVLKIHHLYMKERHEIYKRKELEKLQQPWTDKEVFLKYRFTNVRRELDRESKWLIENISENGSLNLKDKILNSILFRTFNKSETLKLIGAPITKFETLDLEKYKNIFIEKSKQDKDYVFFTPAFMTGGLKKGNAFKNPPYVRRVANIINPDGTIEPEMEYIKARDFVNEREGYDLVDWEKNIPTRMLRFVQRESNEGIVEDILNCEDQKCVFERLLEITGFGDFLAYQVFVDLTYIPEFPFSENEFTISGPGCCRGLDYLFLDKDGMNYEECLFWIKDNIQNEWEKRGLEYDPEELFDHLDEENRNFNVMMVENSFCELSKMVKFERDEGRPRNRYTPNKQNNKTLF